MDVLRIAYEEFSDAQPSEIVSAYSGSPHFKEDIINKFYEGIEHKPHTRFARVKEDVLADKEPNFRPMNFCSIIRHSRWSG